MGIGLPDQTLNMELLGESGDLTASLAIELVRVAEHTTGPWAAQVLTGYALRSERVQAIYRSRHLIPERDRQRTGGS